MDFEVGKKFCECLEEALFNLELSLPGLETTICGESVESAILPTGREDTLQISVRQTLSFLRTRTRLPRSEHAHQTPSEATQTHSLTSECITHAFALRAGNFHIINLPLRLGSLLLLYRSV